nr:MAG TPA: chromosome segregation ATPase [Caudoviricetes sp.]
MPIEFGHLPQRVQALQKRLDELFDQFWTFAQKFKNLPPDIGDRIVVLETKLRENASKITELVAKMAQLETGLGNANDKITALGIKVNALEPAVEGLRNALNELKAKVEENKDKLTRLEQRITRVDDDLQQLKAKHEETQIKITELVAKLEDHARRIGVLEQWMILLQNNRLPAIETDIAQLKTDRDNINGTIGGLTNAIRDNGRDIEGLKEETKSNKQGVTNNEKVLKKLKEDMDGHAAKDLAWTPATNTLSWGLNGEAKTAVISGGGGGTSGVKSITYSRNSNQIYWEDGNGSHFADIPFYHDTFYKEPILGNNVRLGQAILQTKSINELGQYQVRNEIDISSLIYNIVDKFFKPYENYIYADEEFLADRNKYNLLAHKCIQTVVGFGDGYADIKKHWEQNQIYPEIITGLKTNFPLQHNAIFAKYYGKENYDVQNTNVVIQGTTFRYSTSRDATIVNTGIDFYSIVQTLPDTPDSSINSKPNFKHYTTRLRNLVYTGETDAENLNHFVLQTDKLHVLQTGLNDWQNNPESLWRDSSLIVDYQGVTVKNNLRVGGKLIGETSATSSSTPDNCKVYYEREDGKLASMTAKTAAQWGLGTSWISSVRITDKELLFTSKQYEQEERNYEFSFYEHLSCPINIVLYDLTGAALPPKNRIVTFSPFLLKIWTENFSKRKIDNPCFLNLLQLISDKDFTQVRTILKKISVLNLFGTEDEITSENFIQNIRYLFDGFSKDLILRVASE